MYYVTKSLEQLQCHFSLLCKYVIRQDFFQYFCWLHFPRSCKNGMFLPSDIPQSQLYKPWHGVLPFHSHLLILCKSPSFKWGKPHVRSDIQYQSKRWLSAHNSTQNRDESKCFSITCGQLEWNMSQEQRIQVMTMLLVLSDVVLLCTVPLLRECQTQ